MSDECYCECQQWLKDKVDVWVVVVQDECGIVMVFIGNGKGKIIVVFGIVICVVGYGKKVGVIQFIKGIWFNGECNLLEFYGVEFQVMVIGFIWNIQDCDSDIVVCLVVWEYVCCMFVDDQFDLVLLDELIYMVVYDYLLLELVLSVLCECFVYQLVIIIGCGCYCDIIELVDIVSELCLVKYVFDVGIKVQMGIDY